MKKLLAGGLGISFREGGQIFVHNSCHFIHLKTKSWSLNQSQKILLKYAVPLTQQFWLYFKAAMVECEESSWLKVANYSVVLDGP